MFIIIFFNFNILKTRSSNTMLVPDSFFPPPGSPPLCFTTNWCCQTNVLVAAGLRQLCQQHFLFCKGVVLNAGAAWRSWVKPLDRIPHKPNLNLR